MKTKAQKQQAVEVAKDLIGKNGGMVLADVQGITMHQNMQLRRAVRDAGGRMVVFKKRLLGVAMKDLGFEFNTKDYAGSVGAVFTPEGVETASGPVVKFYKTLKADKTKVLGGYDFAKKEAVDQATVLFVGNLPSREVVLAQLMGMLQAPVRSFLYILQEKSKQTS